MDTLVLVGLAVLALAVLHWLYRATETRRVSAAPAQPAPVTAVIMPCYRDAQRCARTLDGMFRAATFPHSLRAVVVHHRGRHEPSVLDAYDRVAVAGFREYVSVLEFPADTAQGPTMARAAAAAHIQFEHDYVLYVDCHAQFTRGWDTALQSELLTCTAPRPCLTTLPPQHGATHATFPRPSSSGMLEGAPYLRRPMEPLPSAWVCMALAFMRAADAGWYVAEPFAADSDDLAQSMAAFAAGVRAYTPALTHVTLDWRACPRFDDRLPQDGGVDRKHLRRAAKAAGDTDAWEAFSGCSARSGRPRGERGCKGVTADASAEEVAAKCGALVELGASDSDSNE